MQNFGSREDTVFCGVFDGHGPLGHVIAKKVRDSLPSKLIAKWNRIVADDLHANSPSLDEEEPRAPIDNRPKVVENTQIFKILYDSFRDAFKKMDGELKQHHYNDCFCSGTTAVTLVKKVGTGVLLTSPTCLVIRFGSHYLHGQFLGCIVCIGCRVVNL